jgi:hypothetical protein
MATTKHEDPAPAKHDEPRKTVLEAGELVMPLAEPGPGAPLVGATGVKGEHIVDGERDPDTIAEEQRIRSAEYEAHGYSLNQATATDTRKAPPPLQHQPAHKDDHHTTKK